MDEEDAVVQHRPLKRMSTIAYRGYKREPSKRVFVNRSLMLERVKFYGFDMDYTLAMYKSPEYETLGFDLIRDAIVTIGYPDAIKEFKYDPTFPIRGLWFDMEYGNIIKADPYGNILVCVHGFKFLKMHDLHKIYPNRFVQRDEQRFRIFNTLYDLPIIYLLACLVDFFTNHSDYTNMDNGVRSGDITMTWHSIYQDVMSAVGIVHDKNGPLKGETVKSLEKYVIKDERLPILLDRMRAHGSKVFLATNSGYQYTNRVMSYMLNDDQRDWTSYFDYIVVDAKKPLFFEEGTILRQVDKETGALKLGAHTGPIQSGQIYSGGSISVFHELMKIYDQEVLYVGDHIFGDILKTKKVRGWRTFLVVPELAQELLVWTKKKTLFEKLEDLDVQIGELYRHLDSGCDNKPNIGNINRLIKETTHEMDMAYGILGSVFRSGSRHTFFASQILRFADLYAASVDNLLHYPFYYVFRAPNMLMPHESTVDHEDILETEAVGLAPRTREMSEDSQEDRRKRLERTHSIIPNLYAPTPRQFTQILDDDSPENTETESSNAK
ncbi:cytosolic purine 5'-nucleotidase-like isoform X2 [Ostrea edulis]|uniref:cytosolic purine 5'-nucleotidase-like isoform X2 n=1 Tax=Ostrea edulis TaxID=37623 RepID=UPI0024AFEBF0|nr:cytosolic purine 5'-nucleotidase-like isoform X2 [Ostrea edulis]